jgi:hypothetical protein
LQLKHQVLLERFLLELQQEQLFSLVVQLQFKPLLVLLIIQFEYQNPF